MFRYLLKLLIIHIRIFFSFLFHKLSKEDVKETRGMVTPLDPADITKFSNQLVTPPVYEPQIIKNSFRTKVKNPVYFVDVSEFKQQILPFGFPKTTVWGYGGTIRDPETGRKVYFRNSPGATFEAKRGIPVTVKWINRLRGPSMFAVDPTLHWANPNNIPMDHSQHGMAMDSSMM